MERKEILPQPGDILAISGYTIHTDQSEWSKLTVELTIYGSNLSWCYFEPTMTAIKNMTLHGKRKPSEPLSEGTDGKTDAKESR